MDVTPYHLPGDTVTGHAEAAVIGGRFVAITGPRVGGNYQVSHAAAGARSVGVAARDTAAGAKVMLFGGPGTVVDVTAATALTAGNDVVVGADGQATTGAGVIVGVAMDDVAAGAAGPIRLI